MNKPYSMVSLAPTESPSLSQVVNTPSSSNTSASVALAKAADLEARQIIMGRLVHDFANVVTGILSLSETSIDEVPTGSPVFEALELIKESAWRAHSLLRTISDLSPNRRTAGVPVEGDLWVARSMSLLQSLTPKGARFESKLSAGTPALAVDEADLRCALFAIFLVIQHRFGAVSVELCTRTVGKYYRFEWTLLPPFVGDFTGLANTGEDTPEHIYFTARQKWLLAFAQRCHAELHFSDNSAITKPVVTLEIPIAY